MASTHVIVAVSDQHCGSSVALCPPVPIPLDDGGEFLPSKAQQWLYGGWEDVWRRAAEIRERESAVLHWLNNGDAVDGAHHNSPQMPSTLSITHADIFYQAAKIPIDLCPDYIIGVRGTEAHGGLSNQTEEGIFRGYRKDGKPVVGDPERGSDTWWHFRREIGGLLIDATHHGRMGQRTHTKEGYLRHYAFDIWANHVKFGDRPPDICIRSHFHQKGDSGRPAGNGTRVIALGAFQLMTGYGYKKHADNLADVGGSIIVIRNRDYEVHHVYRKPDRTPNLEPIP